MTRPVNLTFDLGETFTYDVTGQQATASYGGYLLQQYYDGDGLRVKKTENGATTWYLRSSVLGGQVVAEINGGGAWQRGFVYAGGSLLAVQAGGVNWVHEDPVTKSKRVTDINGAIVSYVELDPWGADTNRSSNAAFQPKKFTSYERDGNASDEAMFRRYNRWHSRFDQPDPYEGSYDLTNPQSLNRYAYVQNDPVNFVDPSGLLPQICGLFYVGDGQYGFVCFGGNDPFGGFNPKMGGGQKPKPKPKPTPKPCDAKLTGDSDADAVAQYLFGESTNGTTQEYIGMAQTWLNRYNANTSEFGCQDLTGSGGVLDRGSNAGGNYGFKKAADNDSISKMSPDECAAFKRAQNVAQSVFKGAGGVVGMGNDFFWFASNSGSPRTPQGGTRITIGIWAFRNYTQGKDKKGKIFTEFGADVLKKPKCKG